ICKERRLVQIWRARNCAGPERGDHNDVRTSTEDGQELLHQKKRTSYIRRKKVVEVLYCVVVEGCGLAASSVGHEHVQSLADDRANFLRQQGCSFRSSQVGADCVRASTF